jgi:hypothetical protein
LRRNGFTQAAEQIAPKATNITHDVTAGLSNVLPCLANVAAYSRTWFAIINGPIIRSLSAIRARILITTAHISLLFSRLIAGE